MIEGLGRSPLFASTMAVTKGDTVYRSDQIWQQQQPTTIDRLPAAGGLRIADAVAVAPGRQPTTKTHRRRHALVRVLLYESFGDDQNHNDNTNKARTSR
jgi:hypothetical protein